MYSEDLYCNVCQKMTDHYSYRSEFRICSNCKENQRIIAKQKFLELNQEDQMSLVYDVLNQISKDCMLHWLKSK